MRHTVDGPFIDGDSRVPHLASGGRVGPDGPRRLVVEGLGALVDHVRLDAAHVAARAQKERGDQQYGQRAEGQRPRRVAPRAAAIG